ncbi:hypothetical protein [Furfurilactobacillus entadae]|uniref:hypothetical protein n=1 Tax=Furfurilactobacillus entadae TaxID=2922307 RepID=UPI0035E83465
MNQQWHDEAVGAVRGLLKWAGLINIFVGVVLAWTMMSSGANFTVYLIVLVPAIVGVWEYTKVNQISEQWLTRPNAFYWQAVISLILASWISSILLWTAGRRIRVIAEQHQ